MVKCCGQWACCQQSCGEMLWPVGLLPVGCCGEMLWPVGLLPAVCCGGKMLWACCQGVLSLGTLGKAGPVPRRDSDKLAKRGLVLISIAARSLASVAQTCLPHCLSSVWLSAGSHTALYRWTSTLLVFISGVHTFLALVFVRRSVGL